MLVDTCAWVDFFQKTRRSEALIPYIRENPLYTAEVSLAEISDWCFRNGLDAEAYFQIIRKHSAILGIPENAWKTIGAFYNGQRKHRPKFGMMDCLIAATARSHGLGMLTFDLDFEGIPGAVVLR